ncbi:MAG: hypothetical protein KA841_03080 [Chitinophagales bacterium]|jgi:hypothetical protein|nr:hypothetical protein [Chitinophagales bacterium]
MHSAITYLLKAFTAILLVTCIVVESTGKGGILISYLANKQYIAENLCANKSNKKLHCNGKCYLTKQLEEGEKKEQSPAQPINKMYDEEFIMDLPETSVNSRKSDVVVSTDLTSLDLKYISVFGSDIFHPPA